MIYAKSIRYVFGWLCFALGTLFLLPTARGEPADDVSPFIRITNPVDNSIISNNIPYITIEFGDGGSGVDPGSLRILINDTDYTGVFEITETSASFQPLGPFSLGNHSISASISDKAGNTANADADFTVAASSQPIRYLFSVEKNPWIFASPGDGTYQEYLSAEDLGLLDSSDVVALSKMMPDGNIFFTLYDQKGLRQSAGDGSSRLHFDNDQLGLEQDNRILAGHIGQDGSFYLAIEGRPDIRQSSGTYTGSYFLQSVKLGIEDSARIKCLHLGDNDIIYFCHSGAHSIFQSTGDGTYSRFLTAADLGVAGSEIDAFAILSETGAPDTKEDAGGPVVSPSTYSLASVEAAINAAPTKGGIPLEVQFSAQVTGGTPPYTYAWDIDGDSSVDETRKQFSYIYQTAGLYAVTLTVTDSEAVPATDSVTIAAHVTPTVVASTNPVGGGAPLTVNLSAMVNDPDGAIVLYEWDFDGDGTYDYTDTDSAATTHTYPTNGLYRAVIRVTDNDNLSATDDVTVAVGELPTVTAGASATDGTAPLEVSFTGTATDSDGSIALYEWDFDGDGVFDWSSPTTGDTSYTYDRSGFFNAAFRATDNDGLTAGASIMISVSGPPIALPGAFPTEGDVPLTVTFFSDGKDPDGSLVEFAWDLDDNGSYEWKDMVAGSVTHTYHTAGVHNAVLKVTDSDGLIGTAPITINATDPNPQGYPLANAIAHPVNGGAPLDVALVGNADDANGSLVKYEWDFDGDGTYDWEEFEKAIATIGLLIDVNSYSTPEFVDIDNDGDIDLFIGETNGRIYFYRNDGNSKAPRWAAMGLVTDADATTIDVGNHSIPALTDIDNDGDLDLFIGQNEGRIHFYRNDGNSESPVWTPLGLLTDAGSNTIDVGSWSTPVFADIDDDEDTDLFVGESYGRISFYRNDGNRNAPVWTPMGFISDADSITIDIGSYSEATFTDIDNDGDLDMFGGYSQGRIYFYRNDGSAGAPLWASQGLVTDSNDNTIDAGSYSSPVFKDIDNDGDGDMFLGRSSGEIVFYRNTGDASAPIWNLVTKKYNYIEVSNYATPALADTDNDGDADLYVGDYQDGVLHFWRNDGNAGSPAWRTPGLLVTADNGEPIDIGNFNSPAFADLDNDGDFDLFIGEHSGRIHFYRNDGDSGTPFWTAQGFLMYPDSSLIDIGSNSHPAFVDIDDDGDFDLFVGEYYGKIQFIRNEGNSNVPLWAYVGLIENSEGNPISVPYRSRPAFADMDHDGDHDLLIGCNNGKAYYYRNDGDAQTPIWNRASSNFDDLDLNGSSAPYFVDLDNDRDFDVIIGNGVGDIYLYRTSGQIFHLYETPGTYEATFRVTDNQDLSSEDTVTIRVYETGSPTALALAEPVTGDIPLTVSFYGKGTDPDGTITLYEWDFDGDGTYDWNSTTTGNTSHSYAYAGTFSATLRVTDDSGKTATDAVIIEPRLSITTSRTDAFNPFVGEQGTITLTIGDAAVITIWIIDADGNVVRTLVFDESRAAGTYEDIWDGRNDAGQLVPDGAYFFLIEYTVSNGTYIYDLRTAALYEQNYSGITHPSIFAPYEDDFYQVTYELPKPAYVRMHTWTWDYGYGPMGLVKTLLVKELIGAGTHTEIWDGTDDKGRPAPTDKLYALGQIFWEVPDNAIIIKGGRPEITDVSADPNYFSPVYNPYGSTPTPTTIVRYHLSESSDVACTVVNAQGLVVKMISKQNLPAGSNAIVWDGRDDDGNMVSAGRYTISLLATDGKGNQSKPRSAFLVVYY